ncbi:MAG: hypothetical protein LBQ66_08985 [Planctomycetaceae bacterium]|jgi:hypothetical protein|nr:hypothetical protein [Planctomycetaceae bacterium]
MSPFEIGMLVCFGISWPISILKLLRAKSSEGKSMTFAIVVVAGYFCGMFHKLFYNLDPVIFLYVLNTLMIMLDLLLTIKYRQKKHK